MNAGPKRIALVAVDSTWVEPSGVVKSFSYGIEKLRAALLSSGTAEDDDILLLDLPTPDPQEFLARIVEFQPTLVGLSTFFWSLPVFVELAAMIKAWNPNVQVIAGGPAARRSVLDLPPYRPLRGALDGLVPHEGEGIILESFRHHLEDNWQEGVAGVETWSANRGWKTGATPDRVAINEFPSPYALGLAPRGRTGYIETFRGCPIHCSFCQWGEQASDRVHTQEYLEAHLAGLKEHDVADVNFLDAAFNLSPRAFRALLAAEKNVGVLADKAVNGHLYPAYLKDMHLELFDMCRRCELHIGVQSFDTDVLRRMNRPFDLKRFERVVETMRGQYELSFELIYGLPGDNMESFKRTIDKALEIADVVKVFRCLVLPDALMDRASPEFKVQFDPLTFKLTSCLGWSERELDEGWEWLGDYARQMPGSHLDIDYIGFGLTDQHFATDFSKRDGLLAHVRVDAPEERGIEEFSIDICEQLRMTIADQMPGWGLRIVRNRRDGLFFDIDSPEGELQLAVARKIEDQEYFVAEAGVAYWYKGKVSGAQIEGLKKVIALVHDDAVPVVMETAATIAAESGGASAMGAIG